MGHRTRKVAILGSTGSVGSQALEVVRAFPQRLKVVGLAAGSRRHLLSQQVSEFLPSLVHGLSAQDAAAFGCRAVSLGEMASHPEVDVAFVATSGRVGLEPTLAALEAGKVVALANKEAVVAGGELLRAAANRGGGTVIPVDSEHSAVWQCLQGEGRDLGAADSVARIILTASGGPFRGKSLAELEQMTAKEALCHPTWQMGRKITIDSATMMNKGLEILEGSWFFQVGLDRIQVVIHPECIVHSLVEFVDGSVKAQMSLPDMRVPIQYSLSYPERWEQPWPQRLELAKLARLTFEEPDPARFPCLGLAREAGRLGGTYPCVLCAADEVAVELFLERKIRFLDIPRLVDLALQRHRGSAQQGLEEIAEADQWARALLRQLVP